MYWSCLLRYGSGINILTFSQQKEAVKKSLRVLYKTESVSPHPIAVHPRISDKTVEQISAAFIALNGTDKGRAILESIPIKKIGPASMKDYISLKSMGLDEFYERKN